MYEQPEVLNTAMGNRALSWRLALLLPLMAGCQNTYTLQAQNQTLQQQMLALQQRNDELQSRAGSLDGDHQEQQTLLAQARQQVNLLEEQLIATRDQLKSTTGQLAQSRSAREQSDQKIQTLNASIQRGGGAAIRANSSLQRSLPSLNIPGVEVRVDGDVVRVELPASRLFAANSNTLLPNAQSLVSTVARELKRSYPDQRIGVEGHTANDPGRPGGVYAQQVSTARASAVYQYLVTGARIPAEQMFVVGHAGNHPVVSNGEPAGRQRNHRVELVIYPERI